jgi:hypothetical protein
MRRCDKTPLDEKENKIKDRSEMGGGKKERTGLFKRKEWKEGNEKS